MNSLVTYIIRTILPVSVAVVLGVFVVAGLVSAATTVSLSVITGGGVYASSTGAFDGAVQFWGGASTTDLTLLNGETISNSTNGTITFTADNTVLVGTASSSAIRVGDEPSTVINGIAFGYCSFGNITSFAASTTRYVDCTTTPTNVLTSSDRIFIMATSSFDTDFHIEAASSTSGGSTITLRIRNNSSQVADTTLGSASVNFIAVR